jgi:ring-1,2-phenylacetyl-CoA epoxidase subunit PaaD
MVTHAAAPTGAEVLNVLAGVMDPEIPVISVVDLGIVRGVVKNEDGSVTVRVTPTYSGCPAVRVIEHDIVAALAAAGISARIETVFSPPWTTDWITADGREKLRAWGVAPPAPVRGASHDLVQIGRASRSVECPFCGSHDTVRESEFGSTACKAIHVCRGCQQPFEEFKAI